LRSTSARLVPIAQLTMRATITRLVPIGLAIGLATVFGGCGSATGVKQALDPVAQAAATTTQTRGGMASTFSASMILAGEAATLRGSAVTSPTGFNGTLQMSMQIGAMTVDADEVLTPDAIYLRSNQFDGKLPGGKHWIAIDLKALGKGSGIDLGALMAGGASQDPTRALQYLLGAGSSTRLGAETVRGIVTTRYHVDVQLRKVAGQIKTPAAKKAMEKAVDAIGATTIPIDVWIDRKNLIRREQIRLDYGRGDQRMTMNMTIDITRYHVPLHVMPPPSYDTVDISSIAGASA
jgi:hypothetical protein